MDVRGIEQMKKEDLPRVIVKYDPNDGGWMPVSHMQVGSDGGLRLKVEKDDPGVSDVHISTTGKKPKKKPKAQSFDDVMADTKKVAVKQDAEWGNVFEITKVDEDQNLVFGWANIVEKDGVVVTDSQGDQIDIVDLEKAAYDYAMFSREAGEMHERTTGVGQMVESMVMTLEKQAALGIPQGSTPLGWWVGFKLAPDTFAKVKDGTYPMFSIGGLASREEI
jgi:hypothetical protein